MVNLVNTAAIGAVEVAINTAISLDTGSQHALANMAGTHFYLKCLNPKLNLCLLITDTGEVSLRRLAEHELELQKLANNSCALEGEFKDLIALLTAKDKANALVNSEMKIHGDSRHLMELQEILGKLDLDWEAQLAKLTGDVVAHQIGKSVRGFLKWRKYAHERIAANFTEYMQEEGKLTPPALELEHFYQDIRSLGQSVDRISVRAQKLQQLISERQQTKEKLHAGENNQGEAE